MIKRVRHSFIVSCDKCSYEEEYDIHSYDFMEVVGDIRESGWRIAKAKGEWQHTCPDCLEKVLI